MEATGKAMFVAGKKLCGTWSYTWCGVLLCTKPPHDETEPHHDEDLGVEWHADGTILPQRATPVERAREGAGAVSS